jgi:hypothetical protein
MAQQQSQASGGDMAAQIAQAFAEVQQGNLAAMTDVEKMGAAAVPLVANYLANPDEAVRREAVSLLGVVAGKSALAPLTDALVDQAAEIRERAAVALYQRYDPETVVAQQPAAKTFARHMELGEPAASVLLMLGYLPGDETERLLREHIRRARDETVKLFPWSDPVPSSLPAQVALARLGDRQAMAELVVASENGAVAELVFLLSVVRDIDAPRVLHAVKKCLDDERETTTGVPSGTQPKRRVCDEAVDAFVARLKLDVSFPLRDSQRYRPEELDEVRRLINQAIPQ